jgi:hypothetical protein
MLSVMSWLYIIPSSWRVIQWQIYSYLFILLPQYIHQYNYSNVYSICLTYKLYVLTINDFSCLDETNTCICYHHSVPHGYRCRSFKMTRSFAAMFNYNMVIFRKLAAFPNSTYGRSTSCTRYQPITKHVSQYFPSTFLCQSTQ